MLVALKFEHKVLLVVVEPEKKYISQILEIKITNS
jgi:hypothetical protein